MGHNAGSLLIKPKLMRDCLLPTIKLLLVKALVVQEVTSATKLLLLLVTPLFFNVSVGASSPVTAWESNTLVEADNKSGLALLCKSGSWPEGEELPCCSCSVVGRRCALSAWEWLSRTTRTPVPCQTNISINSGIMTLGIVIVVGGFKI